MLECCNGSYAAEEVDTIESIVFNTGSVQHRTMRIQPLNTMFQSIWACLRFVLWCKSGRGYRNCTATRGHNLKSDVTALTAVTLPEFIDSFTAAQLELQQHSFRLTSSLAEVYTAPNVRHTNEVHGGLRSINLYICSTYKI